MAVRRPRENHCVGLKSYHAEELLLLLHYYDPNSTVGESVAFASDAETGFAPLPFFYAFPLMKL